MDGDLYCMCEHQKPRRSAQPRYRALAARFQNITIHLEVDSGFIACASNECQFALSRKIICSSHKTKRSPHAVVGFEFLKKQTKKTYLPKLKCTANKYILRMALEDVNTHI